MPDYSVDADLIRKRSEIMDYLPENLADWGEFHSEAKGIIDRDLEVRWYRLRFPDWAARPFDPARLINVGSLLTRLSCFKTLELIFGFLDNGAPESAFAKLKSDYADSYLKEMEAVLALGLDYDISGDGELSQGEKTLVGHRFLVRG